MNECERISTKLSKFRPSLTLDSVFSLANIKSQAIEHHPTRRPLSHHPTSFLRNWTLQSW